MLREPEASSSTWVRELAHDPGLVNRIEEAQKPQALAETIQSFLDDKYLLEFVITARAAQIVARDEGILFEDLRSRLWGRPFIELCNNAEDTRLLLLVTAKAAEVLKAGWPFILFTSDNPDPYYCLYGGVDDPVVNPDAPQRAEPSKPGPRRPPSGA
ncbi:hypothetical protein EST38_g14700 [Candolleomyces aberdarensis]|uniref:Uncharacterized protein n=1 Tax=Candolleomyces aberdarensis TaxID=2316362 RepID=A0A4Q2CZA0_9AGAR|nr:hypothetical protein EST38_g14700 [Candolleomyces aberdarensis]